MVTMNGKNINYQQCIMSAKNALATLKSAERQLGKAWEQDTAEFTSIIEDLQGKIEWLEAQYK